METKNLGERAPVIPAKPVSEYLLICGLCGFVSFDGFVFGFDTGTISGFVSMGNFLERFGELNDQGVYYFSRTRTGLIVSIFNIGCAIGGIVLSKCADLWGRRLGLLTAMCIYVVGIFVQISSLTAWYQCFIGRLITGLAVGTVSVLSPLFIGETAPKHLISTMVYCCHSMITFGIFMGYCTTYGTERYPDSKQWRIPLWLCFAWAFLLMGGIVFMPESSRYLV